MSSHRTKAWPLPVSGREPDVERDAETVAPFLKDAAHYPGGHTIGVAQPCSEAEIATLMCGVERLLPVGVQSSLTGGATPMGELIVSTSRLNRIVTISKQKVTVQPGVPLAVLQEAIGSYGAFYPPVPTFDGASAGGVVATNAAGVSTFKYGSVRAWVCRLRVVLATGDVLEITRGEVRACEDGYFSLETSAGVQRVPVPSYRMPDVPKRSAGYFAAPGMDLIDLFIGSEGTLGIVTEITFALASPKPAVCLAWVPLASERAAIDLVATLRAASAATWRTQDPRGIDVAGIEHLDRRSLDLVKEDGADRTHAIQVSDDTTVALLAHIEVPSDSIPTPEKAYEQISGSGSLNAPDTPLVRLCRLFAQAGILDRVEITLPQDQRRRAQLLAIREAVPEAVNRRVGKAKRTVNTGIAKTAADMIVPFEHFADILELFRTAFAGRDLDHAIWGHISDGHVHPNVIPHSLDDVRRGNEAILECGRAIVRLNGCPLAEHGVGRNAIKQALLRQLYGDAGIDEMRRVKAALDPTGKLAPGVIFSAPAAGRSLS